MLIFILSIFLIFINSSITLAIDQNLRKILKLLEISIRNTVFTTSDGFRLKMVGMKSLQLLMKKSI